MGGNFFLVDIATHYGVQSGQDAARYARLLGRIAIVKKDGAVSDPFPVAVARFLGRTIAVRPTRNVCQDSIRTSENRVLLFEVCGCSVPNGRASRFIGLLS